MLNPNGKVGVILQARMGSMRLPGKVLKPLLGRPMLEWILIRLGRMKNVVETCVATSSAPGDRVLIDFLKENGIPYFVGSETDVLDRYYQCAKARKYAHVVRATADNPFVDPDAGDDLVDLHFTRKTDYANSFPEQGSGFPKGTGLEIFSFAALETSWRKGHAPHHREHVNEFILENLSQFKHCILEAGADKRAPNISLTVDLPDEFVLAERIYREYFSATGRYDVPLAWVVGRQSK